MGQVESASGEGPYEAERQLTEEHVKFMAIRGLTLSVLGICAERQIRLRDIREFVGRLTGLDLPYAHHALARLADDKIGDLTWSDEHGFGVNMERVEVRALAKAETIHVGNVELPRDQLADMVEQQLVLDRTEKLLRAEQDKVGNAFQAFLAS